MNIAEIEVRYLPKLRITECPQVKNSEDTYRIFMEMWNDDFEMCESFYMMLLNRANRVKGIRMISKGGIEGTVVDQKLIFAPALKTLSSGIILAHNHPSGNLKPSQSDISLTKKVRDAGELLDISLLDHLILTTEGHYSFADDGII